MFKYIAIISVFVVCALGKPSVVAPVAFAAAPAVVTAASSQYQVRNHNAIAAPVALAAAPLAYAAAPAVVTATSSQYQVRNHNTISAPLVAAPAVYAAAPLAYASSPYSSAYTYSSSWNLPYAAPAYVV